MMHEHLLLDLTCYLRRPDEASLRAYWDRPVTMDWLGNFPALFWHSVENMRLLDERAAIEEVLKYRYAGGGALADTTSMGIARDPLALARISRATGLKVVMGGSYYVSLSHPADMDKRTEDSIARQIIRDVKEGVGDTGVRSGLIGEVGCSDWPLPKNERKALRASGTAQAETGAPVSIHTASGEEAKHGILDILADGGADPRHVIMGHLDSYTDRRALKRLAQTGCFMEIDVFGWEHSALEGSYEGVDWTTDAQRIDNIQYLIEQGHVGQILIAQDVCQKWMYTRYGGKGFAHILENIVPRMRKRGFTDAHLKAILVDNPARALTFR
jgi:phosphotriesterase-related protein